MNFLFAWLWPYEKLWRPDMMVYAYSSALSMWRQENCKSEAILSYTVKAYLQKIKTTKVEKLVF